MQIYKYSVEIRCPVRKLFQFEEPQGNEVLSILLEIESTPRELAYVFNTRFNQSSFITFGNHGKCRGCDE
jgi:hypothetical protein